MVACHCTFDEALCKIENRRPICEAREAVHASSRHGRCQTPWIDWINELYKGMISGQFNMGLLNENIHGGNVLV